jgi:glycosyltransferase involved in cell wall biosynthesis
MNSEPLVSIITISYNSAKTIENSIRSVLRQTYKHIEYIVIDGCSTDGTLDIINKYKQEISVFISEPDNGISDAWNKGLKIARGEIIGLLNADDIYNKETIRIITEKYQNSADKQCIYYGQCVFINNNQIVGINKRIFNEKKLISGFSFTHTACFVSKAVYDRIGGFNISVKIAMDSEFLLRCHLSEIKFEYVNCILTYMAAGGNSDKYSKKGYFEYLDILNNYKVISNIKMKIYKFLYELYYPFRKIRKSKVLRDCFRQIKHYLIFFMNFLYNYLFIFNSIRRQYLKILHIYIGKKSSIRGKCLIYSPGKMIIGHNSVINRDVILDNRFSIVIGNNVSIGHSTRIYTGGHTLDSPFFEMVGKPVIIEDYVSIFSNV